MTLTDRKLRKLLASTGTFELKLSKSNGISVIVDECTASYKFVVALLKAGFTVIFLGKKTQDDKIVNYMTKSENSHKILITLDVELYSRINYDQSILLNSGMSVKENVHLVRKFTESKLLPIPIPSY